MANKLTLRYKGQTLMNELSVPDPTNVSMGNQSIATGVLGTHYIRSKGLWLPEDIVIGDKTLHTKQTWVEDDFELNVEEGIYRIYENGQFYNGFEFSNFETRGKYGTDAFKPVFSNGSTLRLGSIDYLYATTNRSPAYKDHYYGYVILKKAIPFGAFNTLNIEYSGDAYELIAMLSSVIPPAQSGAYTSDIIEYYKTNNSTPTGAEYVIYTNGSEAVGEGARTLARKTITSAAQTLSFTPSKSNQIYLILSSQHQSVSATSWSYSQRSENQKFVNISKIWLS